MNDWSVSPAEAIEIQKRLKDEVTLSPLPRPPKLIGGCDVSMNLFAKEGYAGFVTLTYPEGELQSHVVIKDRIPFPYIPGLLSFREIPMLLKAWEALPEKPDVIMVDGVGIAHPRRLGIASHLGLVLEVPTIGCAKSVLIGTYEEPDHEPGSFSYMKDRRTDEIIGAALRTKRNVKPVFVSPGHKITLHESLLLVRELVKKHRLPEPTRLAHETVNRYRVAT
jgi:deoxyribonuclease V